MNPDLLKYALISQKCKFNFDRFAQFAASSGHEMIASLGSQA